MRVMIVVDIQNDFLPGGALEVPRGNEIVGLVNSLMPHFDLVVATQDFHPENHGSFGQNDAEIGTLVDLNGLEQILWPIHCVEGTNGAEFSDELRLADIDKVVLKGTDVGVDSYSGFFDNGRKNATELHEYLQEQGVEEAFIVGLATDYCVKFTALDAAELGYRTFLIKDACRGVNLQEGDVERALEQMVEAGVNVVNSNELLGGE